MSRQRHQSTNLCAVEQVLCVLQRGQYGEVCVFTFTLCNYDLWNGNILGQGTTIVSGENFFCGIYRWWWCVVFYSFAKYFVIMVVCSIVRLVFMSYSIKVSGFVLMFGVYLVLLNVICFLSLGVCLCSRCDVCCV